MFLKKITILSTIFFFLWTSNVFALSQDNVDKLKNNFDAAWWSLQFNDPSKPPSEWGVYNVTKNDDGSMKITDNNWNDVTNALNDSAVSDLPSLSKSSSPQFSCEWGKDALCSEKFTIDTKLFSPGWTGLNKSSSKDTINWFMTTLIKKLMVALWSLALLIMVVWAGFMMFAMGKDDNLNKWKTIFKAWIIALVIALSSYFMVSFLSYILYS